VYGYILYSSPRASKKTHGYGRRLRNSKNAASKSVTRSLRHSRRWRRATSLARYASGLALSSPMTYRWHCSVDIAGNGGRLFDDRLDDRAHS
jgi:hypothetical protein